MKAKIFLMIVFLVILSFSSCMKETTLFEKSAIDMADDDAVADVAFEDVFNTVDNATIIMENLMETGKCDESSSVLSDSCPAITISSGAFPKTISIDYGTGCSGFNGNTRKGKIIVIITGKRNEVGSTRTVTFDNYYFNDIKVEGTKVLTTLVPNSDENPMFSIKLSDGKLTLPDGNKIERAFEHQREWIAGWKTHKNIWDDEWLISGTATGKNIKGIAYTNTILTPLHWIRACEFFVSGVVKIERNGVLPVELNYGTGECDAKAVVTRGVESKEILLKNKHRSMWKI